MKTPIRNDTLTASQAAFEFPKPQNKQADFFNVKNKHIAYGGARRPRRW